MVLAGTGKEGKTKEVVKNREGKMVCVCICMYVCMYYDIFCHVPKNSQLQKNSAHVPTTTKHGTFTPVTRPQRNGHCSNTKRYKTWKEVNVDTGMRHTRRLFLVASRPMLIPLEHRHLVTFLQCQWAWFFAHCAKPLRQTNVKACHFQLLRNKSRRVCGRFQLVNYEESRGLP